jgi:hypothetical protein
LDGNDLKREVKASTFLTPDGLIQAAARSNRAFKYAISAAGLASLVAVIGRYGVSPAALVFGSIVLLVLMIVFFVFGRAVALERAKLSFAALVLVWCFLILCIATALLLFTSTFFNKPLPFNSFLIKQLSTGDSIVDAVFSGSVSTKNENRKDQTHKVCARLSVSGGVVTGTYTNDAGDEGVISGNLVDTSLDLLIVSSKSPGACKAQGRLDGTRKKITAIYNCPLDGEYAEFELTRVESGPCLSLRK